MQEACFGEIQHGHMEQVGYDTYCKLLDEVLKEMQGIEIKEEQDIQIDLAVSSYIPEEYIESSSQKIEIYQDIALCRTEEDIENVIDEIIDRYGTMPDEIMNLIEITRIKELARNLGIIKISEKMDSIIFLYDNNKFNFEVLNDLVKKYGSNIKFSKGIQPYITLKMKKISDKQILNDVKGFLTLNFIDKE